MSLSPRQTGYPSYSPHADAYPSNSPPLDSISAYPPLHTTSTDPYAPASLSSPPTRTRLNRSDSHLHTWSIPDGNGFNGSDEALRSSPNGGKEGEGLSDLPGPNGTARVTGGRAPGKRGRLAEILAVYNTPNQLSFMIVIGVQTVVVLGMIGAVYQTVRAAEGDEGFLQAAKGSPKLETVATYVGIFILSQLFEIGITLDALAQKNIIQLIMLVFFQCAMTTYAAFLPSQLSEAIVDTSVDTQTTEKRVRAFAIVIAAIIGWSTLVMSIYVWRLFNEFGWAVFKWLGADRQLKKFYQLYQIFVCALKFDAFFFCGFTLQFLVLVDGSPTAEKVVTIVAMPVTLVVLVLAAVAVRQEVRTGVYAWLLVLVAGMAYFLFKLVRIYQESSRYEAAKKTLTIFGVVSFLMIVATFVLSGLCMSNFGRGLKERMPNDGWHCFEGRSRKHRKAMAAVDEGRMELD